MTETPETPETSMTSPNAKPVALITGASRGLGFALARALAPTHHIVAVARTTGALEELDDLIQAAGGQATLAPMDITVEGAMATLCRGIYDRWGSIALWAHCAVHAAPLTPAGHLNMKDWQKSVDINVTATGRLITFIAPLLTDESTALFFEDVHGGEKFFGAYGSTKAAQIALARSWAAEHKKSGPRIMIDAPAQMGTATRARFFPGQDRNALSTPAQEASRIVSALPK